MRDAQGLFDDLCGLHRSRGDDRDDADGLHALQRADVRAGLSGRRDQGVGRRRGDVGAEAALPRLPQLRQRVPVRRAEVQHADAPADEMRHVLRPLIEGLKPMCASVCPTGAISFGKYEQIVPLRRTKPVNVHVFGNQHVETKVYLMLPTDADEVDVDGCGVFEGMLTRAEKESAGNRIVDRHAG